MPPEQPFVPSSQPNPSPAPISQTGTAQQPVQVENVQYGVKVGSFASKMSLAFTVASSSLIILGLVLAWTLHGYVNSETDAAERLVFLIAVAIPLIPLFIFGYKRLSTLMQDAAMREDIVFKKRLRRTLWIEVILAVIFIVAGVFEALSVLLLDGEGSALSGATNAVLYGGVFGLLAWWSYTFQRQTAR